MLREIYFEKRNPPEVLRHGRVKQEGALWVPLSEAIKLIEDANTEDYEGKFMISRDLAFLKEAEKVSKEQS